MRFKYLSTVVLCFVMSLLLVKLDLRSLDLFFLDWKQLLASPEAPPRNHFKIFDVTNIQNDTEALRHETLLALSRQISSGSPKAIILSMSPVEVEKGGALEVFLNELAGIPNLYLFSNSTLASLKTFNYDLRFKSFPRPLYLALTNDTQVDLVSRRIITFFDEEKKTPNSDFGLLKEWVSESKPPDFFSEDFHYLNTRQVFIKIWPRFKFGSETLLKDSLSAEQISAVKDKIVLIGTSGMYAMNSVPSINRRWNFFTESKVEDNYWPASDLIATYMTNIIEGDYVKTPDKVTSILWISVGLTAVLFCVLFVEIGQAFLFSSSVLISFVILSFLIFRFTSYNFDVTRVLCVGLLAQYSILSWRYVRHIRQLDNEKYQSRILVKAATAEAVLRMVGQVSHDIRSPLMALSVVNSIAKNHVSKDLSELLDNATMRIRAISDDLFYKYKSKGAEVVGENNNLKGALTELMESYSKVHPEFQFHLDIPSDLKIAWSTYSIQRSFSNLLNNSIEASQGYGKRPEVWISSRAEGDRIIIVLKDNGPGIPKEHISKLFKEGGTFNKKTGTGLGLFQVRSDLDVIGGKISYEDSSQGAEFRISLPLGLEAVSFSVSSLVVILESSEFESPLENIFRKSGAEVISFSKYSEAKTFLLEKTNGREVTLVCDLLFPGQEETGFDLLNACKRVKFFKKVLCTSLVENSNIQATANRNGALLLRRSFLETVKVTVT